MFLKRCNFFFFVAYRIKLKIFFGEVRAVGDYSSSGAIFFFFVAYGIKLKDQNIRCDAHKHGGLGEKISACVRNMYVYIHIDIHKYSTIFILRIYIANVAERVPEDRCLTFNTYTFLTGLESK